MRAGKMVIVVDDADRENEGDLIMAAECATPGPCYGQTWPRAICVPTTSGPAQATRIEQMVVQNRDTFKTDSQVRSMPPESDHGHSAADRRPSDVRPTALPNDLVQLGHVFPLRAKPGGGSNGRAIRSGVDLAKLAGLRPIVVIVRS